MRNKTDVKKILEGIDAMLARLDEIVAKTRALEERVQALEGRVGIKKKDESEDSVLAEWMYGEEKDGSDK